MQPELIVALIASIASVIVAVISLISSIASNRTAARYQKELERLKFNFSRSSNTDNIADTYLSETLKALQDSIQAIQRFKDDIQLVVSAIKTSLDKDAALKKILQSREYIFECYQRNLSSLNDTEERALHKAKNICLSVESFLKIFLPKIEDISDITEDQKQKLIIWRSQLSDMQQILRDGKVDRISRRISGE